MNKMEDKMNKKKSLIIGVIALVVLTAGVGLYFSTTGLSLAQQQGQPARVAELKGLVKSIEGNQIIILNEISTEPELTDAEKAAKKAERSKLSIEERQALKAEESSVLPKEEVSITIPVGTTIKTTTGDSTGSLVDGDLTEIKEGTYISIWVNNYSLTDQTIEFLKIKGSI